MRWKLTCRTRLCWQARRITSSLVASSSTSPNSCALLPSQASVADAAAGADFKVKGMAPDLLDLSHKNAWPITSATYMLAYEKGTDAAKQKGVVDFFSWSLNNGQKMAADLGFVALPANVAQMVEAELKRIR